MQNFSNKHNPVLVLGELSLIHCIGKANLPVITGSEFECTPASFSKYSREHIVFSSYESDDFIKELCDLGKNSTKKQY